MSTSRKTPTLAQCLARADGRAFERRLQQARYYAGIDLGTTNSSVTLVDALALLRATGRATSSASSGPAGGWGITSSRDRSWSWSSRKRATRRRPGPSPVHRERRRA